jgi:hypothetical protein
VTTQLSRQSEPFSDVCMPNITCIHVHTLDQAGDVVLGLHLGGYKPTRFKSEAPPPTVERAVLFSLGASPQLEAAAQLASNLARGVTFSRLASGEVPSVRVCRSEP